MPEFEIFTGDVNEWARSYKGAPFHSLFCDAPYHLQSIVKRFGKDGSAQAKFGKDGAFQRASRGFMQKTWDGGDVAFRVETWANLSSILYPGSFGLSFASTRGYHRMAVAMEDSGLIIHPMIAYTFGSGFPKATRIDNQIDRMNGDGKEWSGHRYGAQALKPALEPIACFQKPYEHRPIDDIVQTGSGALNIDDSRIFGTRWPANFIMQHAPGCEIVGYREMQGYTINRWNDDAHPFGGGAGNEYTGYDIPSTTIPVWSCVDGCPVKSMDDQAGLRKSGLLKQEHRAKGDVKIGTFLMRDRTGENHQSYGDEGAASRFFFQAGWNFETEENIGECSPFYYTSKANGRERSAGLDGDNPHPTVKSIEACKYLAGLLLPPPKYAPRRIVVPFCGSGSEMIGAILAGWEEVIGIELDPEYVKIAEKRVKWWVDRMKLSGNDPKIILAKTDKKEKDKYSGMDPLF